MTPPPDDLSFCSIAGSARTFLDNNLVALDVLDASRVIPSLLGDGAEGFDVRLLPDVLHEGVHHWCFDSPVGVALSLCRAELMERSMLDTNGRRVAQLHARQRVMIDALRPVIEGLACFAEFDAFPGAGHVRARPFEWLSRLGTSRSRLQSVRNGSQSEIDEMVADLVVRMRMLEILAVRKDALLVQPLDPRARGGYLTGYLMVKGLHSQLLERCALARDSELFLAFVQAYVFHDEELAAALLEPPDGSDTPLEQPFALGRRVDDRLSRLMDPAFAADAMTAFDKAHAPGYDAEGDRYTEEVRRSIAVDPGARAGYLGRVEPHLRRLTQDHDEPAIRSVRHYVHTCLTNRDWLCVAGLPGSLRAEPDGRISFVDGPSGTPRLLRAAGPAPTVGSLEASTMQMSYDGPAALECWVGPLGEGALLVLASQEGVHDVVPLWVIGSDEVADFLSTARSNHFLMEAGAVARSAVDDLLAQQEWIGYLQARIDEHLEETLHHQARLAVEIYGGDDDVTSLMWHHGFYDVLEDLGTLKLTSGYGILQSVNFRSPDAGFIRPDGAEHFLDRVLLKGMRAGLNLVSSDGLLNV